ncbi:hypothetical protein B0J11DRAFT_452585 [Dendryphion nanum]|uniref:TPR-like protein n=1 Tax=Dendryphion nanum TaxID=256645 RepID=A0A9P9EKU9_9PLEO|nr:hypothetical protein B0J11DRAFT_452585 [Dendryphion nanum]
MNPPPPLHPERARSHGRVASGDERRRVAIPRRSTRGPLDSDVDDPLADSIPDVQQPQHQHQHQQQTRTTSLQTASPTIAALSPQRILSPTRSETSPLSPHDGQLPDMPSKDFSFLQDPAAFHVLPASNIPPPFLNAPNAPSLTSPLPVLLQTGHFRLAAIAAARNLVASTSPTDHNTLFHLLHIRLSCLCLIQEHALAAQEAKALGDLNSAFYLHPLTNTHLVPWSLRLLVVRLAALGYGEWRKGIMGYYDLARECRETISKQDISSDEKQLWRLRLRDCGIRVANVLVELRDLEGAARHLASLSPPEIDESRAAEAAEILYMETLVHLRIGDITAARRTLTSLSTISSSSSPLIEGTLTALLSLSNSDYTSAITTFRTLQSQFPSNAMVTQNLAVCLLYVGQIAEARQLLIDLVDTSPPFRSAVFNLSTIFELCTERSRDRKMGLVERLAGRGRDGGEGVGFEVANGDFKL